MYLDSNQLSGTIPSGLSNLNNLQILNLSKNNLTDTIPLSFSNLASLDQLDLSRNHFTFASLEKIPGVYSFAIYSPQSNIVFHQSVDLLSVSSGGTLSKNTYKWYQNGTLVSTKTGDSTFTISASGSYYVSVTNAIDTSLTLLSNTVAVNYITCLPQDSLALVDLYDSTNGASWTNHTNWLTTSPVSSWFGVKVQSGRVISIRLGLDVGNNLVGSIPSSIGNLTNLDTLELFSNQLSGNIPSTLGNLLNLIYLNLSLNQLSGNIPSSLGNLTNLTSLGLGQNQLSGSIPSELGNLTNLTTLDLIENQLSGNLPPSLGNLVNITLFDVGDNQLSGPIPSTYDNFTKIFSGVFLNSNEFTFAGMEAIAQAYRNTCLYGSQANIPLYQQGNLLYVSAGGTLSNNTYKWFNNSTLLATKVGDSTYTITGPGNYSAEVINSIATQLVLTTSTSNVPIGLCPPFASITITSNVTSVNNNYQWTVDSNNVTYPLTDDSNYSGTQTISLQLKNIPSSWNGFKYYCIVDGNEGRLNTIQFLDTWTGAVNSTWTNPDNWSCGSVPDANTDVIINSGTVVLSSNATVRSLSVSAGASLTITQGNNLTVTH